MPEGLVNVRSSYRAMWVTLVVLLLAGPVAFAEEAWVTALYEPVPGGYRYYLTVYNNTNPQENNHIEALDVYLTAGSDVESPPNWDYTAIQYSMVHWGTAETTGGWLKGIPPGQSLSGFNVVSPDEVNSFRYKVLWHNGTDGNMLQGYAYPELIPEPSSLLVFAGGLGAFAVLLRRRRR